VIQFNPLTIKQWRRFRSIKRGFWSAVLLLCLMMLSCCAEVLINKRAVVVSFEGQLYFPTYANFFPGKTFGLDYEYETNYRELQEIFNQQNDGNWVWLPLVPYDPYENDLKELEYPPYAPSLRDKHYLGTDSTGRDVVARLVYGFRLAMGFALFLLISQYVIGVAVGCAMGYWGGIFDLFFQRIIEIWNNVPFLYVIMIVASIVVPGFWTLMLVMVIFGWTGMTWYMRTSTYKEKAREYVSAARALGASAPRVVFSHILPNTISIIVTFVPFSIAGGITSLTALDYLGFGLPPPTPSWGELLAQGTSNLETPWIVSSVVIAMVSVLLMVTYVGEAIREAFDPKQFTYYE
jgi:microcin C transport system permease protein